MRAGKFIFPILAVLVCLAPVSVSASEVSAISADALELRGEFIEGGVECPLFKVDDGRVFALQGIDRALIRIGAKATLWGTEAMFSTCQQGPAFSVERSEIDAP